LVLFSLSFFELFLLWSFSLSFSSSSSTSYFSPSLFLWTPLTLIFLSFLEFLML
jgi:hypothetical protein